jgi:hypothetical protein
MIFEQNVGPYRSKLLNNLTNMWMWASFSILLICFMFNFQQVNEKEVLLMASAILFIFVAVLLTSSFILYKSFVRNFRISIDSMSLQAPSKNSTSKSNPILTISEEQQVFISSNRPAIDLDRSQLLNKTFFQNVNLMSIEKSFPNLPRKLREIIWDEICIFAVHGPQNTKNLRLFQCLSYNEYMQISLLENLPKCLKEFLWSRISFLESQPERRWRSYLRDRSLRHRTKAEEVIELSTLAIENEEKTAPPGFKNRIFLAEN